jgi:lysozyme
VSRRINAKGLELIKSFESCRLEAYRDIVGVLTIGWGHTGADVTEHQKIDQAKADDLLREDLARFEAGVERALKFPVNDNQFSAIVSFAFNLGLGNLSKSTLLRCVNSGHFPDAGEEFLKWDKAGGRVVAGLTRRRKAERDLFLAAA